MCSATPRGSEGILARRRARVTGECRASPTVCPFCGCGCNIVLGVEGGRVAGVHPDGRPFPPRTASSAPRAGTGDSSSATSRTAHEPLVRRDGEPRTRVVGRGARRARRALRRAPRTAPDAFGFLVGACTNEDNFASRGSARRVRHQQRRPLRAPLPRPDGRRAAPVARHRRHDQLVRRPRAGRLLLIVGSNTTDPPHLGAPCSRPAARRAAHRRRSAPHRLARIADLHLQLRPGTNVRS